MTARLIDQMNSHYLDGRNRAHRITNEDIPDVLIDMLIERGVTLCHDPDATEDDRQFAAGVTDGLRTIRAGIAHLKNTHTQDAAPDAIGKTLAEWFLANDPTEAALFLDALTDDDLSDNDADNLSYLQAVVSTLADDPRFALDAEPILDAIHAADPWS